MYHRIWTGEEQLHLPGEKHAWEEKAVSCAAVRVQSGQTSDGLHAPTDSAGCSQQGSARTRRVETVSVVGRDKMDWRRGRPRRDGEMPVGGTGRDRSYIYAESSRHFMLPVLARLRTQRLFCRPSFARPLARQREDRGSLHSTATRSHPKMPIPPALLTPDLS